MPKTGLRRAADPLRAALGRSRASVVAETQGPTFARAAVALVMFLIGFSGFARVYRPRTFADWSDCLFRTAQMVTGQFPQELVPAPGVTRVPVPIDLNVARFALPLLVLWIAVSALLRRIRAPLRAAGAGILSDHLILAADAATAPALIADARTAGRRAVVIASGAALSDELLGGAVAIAGDPTIAATWRHIGLSRAWMVAIAGLDDAAAFAATLAAAEVAREERSGAAAPLSLVAAVEDADLRALLDALFRGRDPAEGVVLSATSPARLRARALLARHPLHRGVDVAAGEEVHALIVGFGRTGEELALEVLKTGIVGERAPRITVIDPDAVRLGRAFRERHGHAAPLAQVTFLAESLDPRDGEAVAALLGRIGEVGAIYLCLPDDTPGLLAAIALRRRYAEAEAFAPPIYLRRRATGEIGRQLAEGAAGNLDLTRIHAFGNDDARSLDALMGGTLDARARRMHERYLEQIALDPAGPRTASQRGWATLAEVYRQANRDQADYLPMRLASLGLAEVPASEAAAVDEATIERGARAEHVRWATAAMLAGWRAGERDDEALRHPNLVPFDELDEPAREKDRTVLRRIDVQLADGRAVAPVRVIALGDLDGVSPAMAIVEAGLAGPEEACALHAAAAAQPALRWRLRLDPGFPRRLRRWSDAAARAEALWLIEHAEQVLERTADATPAG